MRTQRNRHDTNSNRDGDTQTSTDRLSVIPAQSGAAPVETGSPAQPGASVVGAPSTILTGRHVLLVSGRSAEADGPGVNSLAVHLEAAGVQVSMLPSGSVIADLLGRRVIGRPDLVVAILPGRGPALAGVRVAERFGIPLLALVASESSGSWGELATLRRATRVAVTSPALRDRVIAAGVDEDRVEQWQALVPSALTNFEQIAGRTLRSAPLSTPSSTQSPTQPSTPPAAST